MERFLSEKLIRWKDSTRRKPLLIHGVRHAGKTWLMKEFGRTAYKKTAYVSFISSPQMKGAFDKDCDPRRILMDIAAWTGVNITPSDTLIILDDTEELVFVVSTYDRPEKRRVGMMLPCHCRGLIPGPWPL